jgi:sugar/nucleoside kinase (ribokinase family)
LTFRYKKNVKNKRLVLISKDKNGAILDDYSFSDNQHNVIEVDSEKVEEKDVIDTCCAGDTFVGGFLYGYLDDKSLKDSVIIGHKTAAKVIQKIGCYFE